MEELEKMKKDLTKTIIDIYEPESSRWNRNHSDRAEWYFIWKEQNT